MPITKGRHELKAEARERQAKRAQLEHEIELEERKEHIARLRALRLAKDDDEMQRRREAAGHSAISLPEQSAR